jgi:hypothetical protein
MANIEDLKDDLILCSTCTQEYDDATRSPKLLPCLHTHCASCLEEVTSDDSVQCMTCSAKHYVPEVGIQGFPKDSTRRNLVDYIQVHRNSVDVLCTDCPDQGSAREFCKECYSFLCSVCSSAHARTQLTRHHNIISVQELRSLGLDEFHRKEKCTVTGHEEQTFSFYCDSKECQIPICTLCAVTNHNQADGHVVRNLGEVYSTNKETVERLVSDLENRVNPISDAITLCEEILTEVDTIQNRVVDDIETLFDSYAKILEAKREQLKDEAEGLCADKRKSVESKMEATQLFKDKVETACQFTARVLAYTDPTEFMQIRSTVANRLEELLSRDDLVGNEAADGMEITFRANVSELDFQELINGIGEIAKPAETNTGTKDSTSGTIHAGDHRAYT